MSGTIASASDAFAAVVGPGTLARRNAMRAFFMCTAVVGFAAFIASMATDVQAYTDAKAASAPDSTLGLKAFKIATDAFAILFFGVCVVVMSWAFATSPH